MSRYMPFRAHLLIQLFILLGMLTSPAAFAATISVNTTEMTIADDGLCSLPEAIIAVNTDTASGAMAGECAAGSTDDVIELQESATYTLTTVMSADMDGDNGLPILTKASTTIRGNGATLVRDDGAPEFRVLEVDGFGVTLSDLTFRNGRADERGGGVLAHRDITVENSRFSRNEAGTRGGGISVQGGDLTVRDTTFILNTAGTWGGGLYQGPGEGTVERCHFTGNGIITTSGSGAGAGGHSSQSLHIVDSVFAGNTRGAVQFGSGELVLENSALYDNGGSYAVFGDTGSHVKIINTTVTDNFYGTSIFLATIRFVTTGEINNSTISGNLSTGITANDPADVAISNTIIADNFTAADCNGNFNSLGYNLDSDGTCGFNSIGDQTAEPLLELHLEPSGNRYFLPVANSPVIDAGSPAPPGSGPGACETADQNHVARPFDGDGDQQAVCTIGATEAPFRFFEDGFESGDLSAWSS